MLSFSAAAQSLAKDKSQPPNIAVGAKYKSVTPPNYWGWKGPHHGDHGQLTDGQIVEDWISGGKPIYELSSSAGWSDQAAVVVIDLGRVQSIGGIALHSVLSPWGPWWPSSVATLVSEDNKTFHLATSVVQVPLSSISPPISEEVVESAVARKMSDKGFKPMTCWYRSEQFHTRGRYVALIMDPSPHTGAIVLDEIEVYPAVSKTLNQPLRGPAFSEGMGGWKSYRLYRAIDSRLERDIDSLSDTVRLSSIEPHTREILHDRLEQIDRRRGESDIPHSASFRAVLPMNEIHTDIFAVQAALWHELKLPKIRLWHSHRWAPLGPFSQPSGTQPRLQVVMAQNAVRSDVVNISNAHSRPLTVNISVSGALAGHLKLFEVPLIDTHAFVPVASALIALDPVNGSSSVTVPAGFTCQIWVRCESKNLGPGTYKDVLRLSVTEGANWTQAVPVSIEITSVAIPDSSELHLGGWDYPDAGSYQVTQENVESYVRMLNQYGINTTWARDVMLPGEYDVNGELIGQPNRQPMIRWLEKFPDSKLYCTVLAFSFPHNDPHRHDKLKSWARDWSDYLKGRGIQPDKIAILIHDEPNTESELKSILELAQAIKKGEPRFKIWNDIHWADPSQAPLVLNDVIRDACDIQCFNVQHMLHQPLRHSQWMTQHGRSDLEWWSYSGGSSHRLSDPYIAFLLRSWFSFHRGLTGAHWWSFGDGHGGYSWNEYLNDGTTRSPLYLSADKVTPTKSMEAIREGAQDYALLKILDGLAAVTSGTSTPESRAAAQLLNQAVPKVLADHTPERWLWDVPKDRSAADRVRVDILRLLESIAVPRR